MTKCNFNIDPAHAALDIFEDQLPQEIWDKKYRYGETETHPTDSLKRVVAAVYKKDTVKEAAAEAEEAALQGLWNPGGRIHAGAGTQNRVTLINCYVLGTMRDSMDDIANVLKDSMLTMQQGGGIGVDFSTLRPSGAHLHRTGAVASGPLPFMDTWDTMCETIMSAGSRRGAMMATICDTHPDLLRFVHAKKKQGRLTNFNVSILVSDAFMDAVRNDQQWDLFFNIPPHGGSEIRSFTDDQGTKQYVYQSVWAAKLWDEIVQTTYEYSEPGIVYVDRVNDSNNLQYCEDIQCTNPCGEQPLPPHGCCNLGSVNLARMVKDPFSYEASFDYELLSKTVKVGVRFLDNVIDVSNYPLKAQKDEEQSKRRIGLGATGLADALAQLRIPYGSRDSESFTRTVFRTIAEEAYKASIALAVERGVFPAYRLEYMYSNFVSKLPDEIVESIRREGIRNGVLLTVAPVGTTSIYYGNTSSGIEPVFAHEYTRKVRQDNGEQKEYRVSGYSARLYRSIFGADSRFPEYMNTMSDLKVSDHLRVQAAAQEWVDASISKTVNCPETMSFDDFRSVYDLAYALGCKGCTTYRPSQIRGSVLSLESGTEATPSLVNAEPLLQRPPKLQGVTYKLQWPSQAAAIYATINHHPHTKKPFEVFFSSKSSVDQEWMTALSLMISSILRMNIDYSFIAEELKQIASAHDGAWVDKRYYGSLPAYLGRILEEHLEGEVTSVGAEQSGSGEVKGVGTPNLRQACPNCSAPLELVAGCLTCASCFYSKCE